MLNAQKWCNESEGNIKQYYSAPEPIDNYGHGREEPSHY